MSCFKLAFCTTACVFSSAALAAPINYGDFAGATVDYLQVTEDQATENPAAQIPLFGTPTVTGDTLDFDPVSFAANSSGGLPDLTSADVEFDIQATDANFIENLRFTEAGNTTLVGLGTDNTRTVVTANFTVDIEEVDGAPTPGGPINLTGLNMSFTPSDGDYLLVTDGAGQPTFNTQWTGVLDVDIEQELIDRSISFVGGATLVTVRWTNNLTALSETNTQAFISKQDADGVSITVNIPEPASAGLVLLAAAGLAAARRR